MFKPFFPIAFLVTALASPAIRNHGLPSYLLPEGSWDCHVHLFSPATYQYAPERSYSPVEANLTSLYNMSSELTTNHKPTHYVFVQPSPYGTNNSLLVDTLRKIGGPEGKARGIAVVNISTVTNDTLGSLHQAGVRGLRINTESIIGGTNSTSLILSSIAAAAQRIKHKPGWVIQLFVNANIWSEQTAGIRAIPQPVIADHFGGMKALSMLDATSVNATSNSDTSAALRQKGFAELLQLQKEGKVWVKLSGFYRASNQSATGYADLEPLVKAFVQNRPDRVIWASDWPHTGDSAARVGRPIDYPEQFRVVNQTLPNQNLRKWVPRDDHWRKLLVSNPACLYNVTYCTGI